MKEYIIDVPFALKLAAQVGHGATAVVLPCMRCLFPHSSHIRAALHVWLHQLPGTASHIIACFSVAAAEPLSLRQSKLCCWSGKQLLEVTLCF